jgi:hypothetical protein
MLLVSLEGSSVFDALDCQYIHYCFRLETEKPARITGYGKDCQWQHGDMAGRMRMCNRGFAPNRPGALPFRNALVPSQGSWLLLSKLSLNLNAP